MRSILSSLACQPHPCFLGLRPTLCKRTEDGGPSQGLALQGSWDPTVRSVRDTGGSQNHCPWESLDSLQTGRGSSASEHRLSNQGRVPWLSRSWLTQGWSPRGQEEEAGLQMKGAMVVGVVLVATVLTKSALAAALRALSSLSQEQRGARQALWGAASEG